MPKLYSFADFYISSPSILVERVGNSCFVYVPLPSDPLEDMRDQILGQVDVEVDKIYDPDKFHITLLYIEDCGLSEISELVSQFMPPIQFEVELASLEIFDDGPSSVLVWRINPDPALLRLQSDLYFRAENQGLPISPYSKPEVYKPHATVAYLKGVPRDIPSIVPFKLSVDKFKVGRDDYNVLFTVHLPTGRGERFFIESHPESNGHTEITQSELKSILSGERIVYGPQRRILNLSDGPFSLRHGKHSGQEGVEGRQGGSAPGFEHVGAENGRQPGDDFPEFGVTEDTWKKQPFDEDLAGAYADAIEDEFGLTPDDKLRNATWIAPDGRTLAEGSIHEDTSMHAVSAVSGVDTDDITISETQVIQSGIIRHTAFTQGQDTFIVSGADTLTREQARTIRSMMNDRVDSRTGKQIQSDSDKHRVGLRMFIVEDIPATLDPISRNLEQISGRNAVRLLGLNRSEWRISGEDVWGQLVVSTAPRRDWSGKLITESKPVERHGTHVGQAGVAGQQGGSAEGFTHGDAGGKESGKTNTKRKDSSTNFGAKKKLFNKPHHVPFADIDKIPDGEDFAELFETQSEWEHPANKIVSDMIEDATRADWIDDDPAAVEEVKEEMVEERMQDTLDEMYNQTKSYEDLPIPPEELVLMGDAEIEDRMRDLAIDQARVELGNYEVEEEVARRMSRGQLGFQDDPDTMYNFSRNDDGEIMGTSMSQFVGSHEGVVEIYEDVYVHDLGIEPPEDLSGEQWLEVSWLATKERGKGYGTQMMGEAFQTAADDNAGLFLVYIESAEGFYETFDPVIEPNTRMAIWTPTQVQELAAEFAEGFEVEKSLVSRESLDEIDIGTEGSKRKDIDLEPMNGAFAEPVDWNNIPRKWGRKIKRENPQFISPADQAVFDARKKAERKQRGAEEDQFLTDVLGKRSIQDEVADLFARLSSIFRHGKHEGQQGVEGQQGGSQAGFTHAGADKSDEVRKAKEVLRGLDPLTDKEPWLASWMAPDGELLAHGHDHQETALKIMEEVDPEIAAADETGLVATDSVISDLGFIRMSKFQDQLGFSIPMKITRAQRNSVANVMNMVKAQFGGRVDMFVDRFGDPESPDLFDSIPASEVADMFGLDDEFYDLGTFAFRHGKHEGQEGVKGKQGGSATGFTHVGAEGGDKGKDLRKKLSTEPPSADEAKRQQEATAQLAAANKVKDAQEREPELTTMMRDLAAEHGGEMISLEFAVKSEESMARKVLLDAEQKDMPPEEAAKDITDANRYTVILPTENYVEGVLAIQKRLEEQGLTKYDEKWRNYFGSGDNYDGYNTVVQDSDGNSFELQFHTAESAEAKKQIVPMYKEFRALPEGSPRRAQLDTQMTAIWETTWDNSGGRPTGWERLPGTMMGQGPSVEPQSFFHGTGAEAAKSIMDSGLKISFSDKDNWMPNVIYAASDRRDALSFAARSSEEKYAVITIDSSLAGSEPSGGGSKGFTFAKDIPSEAIVRVDVYSRGFQRKDDELIETIERSNKKSSHLFVAAAINQLGYSILGPEKSNEGSAGIDELMKELSVLAR